jgi:hypothetical protein
MGVIIAAGECPLPERVPIWGSDSSGHSVQIPTRRAYCPLSAWAINLHLDLELCLGWEGEGSTLPSEVNCPFIGNKPIEFTFLEFHDKKDFPYSTSYVIAYPCRIPKQVLSILEKRASQEYLASRTPIYLMGLTSQKSSTFRNA